MYTDNLSVSKCTQLVQMIINPELEQKKKTSLLIVQRLKKTLK